jgi:hypothetical protein
MYLYAGVGRKNIRLPPEIDGVRVVITLVSMQLPLFIMLPQELHGFWFS